MLLACGPQSVGHQVDRRGHRHHPTLRSRRSASVNTQAQAAIAALPCRRDASRRPTGSRSWSGDEFCPVRRHSVVRLNRTWSARLTARLRVDGGRRTSLQVHAVAAHPREERRPRTRGPPVRRRKATHPTAERDHQTRYSPVPATPWLRRQRHTVTDTSFDVGVPPGCETRYRNVPVALPRLSV